MDIDLPILQTTDNYFYLYHDLDRADDKRGMPFADYECDMKNGRHLIIYGHNMGVNNTDRFSNLQKYRDADYYTAHPYLQLDTLYKSEIYKIVAVYAVTSRESDGDVFHFNEYIDLDDAAEQTFLDEVAKRAFYTTGDYAYPTERLLTLSTCTYQMDDARMVILARPCGTARPPRPTRCMSTATRSFPPAGLRVNDFRNNRKALGLLLFLVQTRNNGFYW